MKTAFDITPILESVASVKQINSILEVICSTANVSFAALAPAVSGRFFVAAIHGENSMDLSLGQELSLDDALMTTIPIESKLSAVLILPNSDGAVLENERVISHLAELIGFHLSEIVVQGQEFEHSKKLISDRERMIGILAHDVRNPIGAISNVAELLSRMELDSRLTKMAKLLYNSTQRMRSQVENILDFSRGHLGGGIKLYPNLEDSMEQVLLDVVALHQLGSSNEIKVDVSLSKSLFCDRLRVAQLLAALLSNAQLYGEPGSTVFLTITALDNEFVLSVRNKGEAIDKQVLQRLFLPYCKSDVNPSQQGIALGLYLSSEIAKAHNGELTVQSDNGFTTFTFVMPQ